MIIGKRPIGTICYMGGVPALLEEFVWSWTQMIQYNSEYLCEPGEYIHYDRAKVSYHSFARNNAVNFMLGEWLLMLDTDHCFEPDMAVRLVHKMHKYDIDVLTGLYQYKSPPHLPVLYYWNSETSQCEVLSHWTGNPEIFEVGSAGAGCLLVKKSVFAKIKELEEEPFDIIPPWSEDHSFFARCRKLGIKTYCCPAVECNHLTIRAIKSTEMGHEGFMVSQRPSVSGFGNTKSI